MQFATIQDGQAGNGTVCITNVHNITTSAGYTNVCVGTTGQNVTIEGGIQFPLSTRKGAIQPFDFANIAGYTFSQNGQAMLGLVAQYSWISGPDRVPVTATDLPNRLPGLYAVVTRDVGLAGNWKAVTGSLIGKFNGAIATFTNGELETRIAASSCPGDVSASGPTCPGQPTLSASNVQFTEITGPQTGESDNLTLFSPASALLFPNPNLVVTEILASTNVPSGSTTATCLSSVPNHLRARQRR